jgi:hypothetical protein
MIEPSRLTTDRSYLVTRFGLTAQKTKMASSDARNGFVGNRVGARRRRSPVTIEGCAITECGAVHTNGILFSTSKTNDPIAIRHHFDHGREATLCHELTAVRCPFSACQLPTWRQVTTQTAEASLFSRRMDLGNITSRELHHSRFTPIRLVRFNQNRRS